MFAGGATAPKKELPVVKTTESVDEKPENPQVEKKKNDEEEKK